MCGISLIADPQIQRFPENSIDLMTGALTHRGPDALSIRRLASCHLGHARLSIIDLETGAQPMSDPTGRYWIVFNGELYNYQQLRAILITDGIQFSTRSDTEVILASYIVWGAACLDRFRGMFAFAIWDDVRHELFAARDLFGEKPLFYAQTGEGILVSSEIKGLLAARLFAPKLSTAAVDAYLALGYVPPDRSIYENISNLPPGHCLVWQAGRAEIHCYWKPRFHPHPISLEDAAAQLHTLVDQAVERQMVADVPVGAFLSGGLDSSTIVALMARHSDRPTLTFSAGFGDDINELPYARTVAAQYGTEHHELDFGSPRVAELLVELQTVYDEPFADTSSIPTYLISKFAREKVKVVLSGDGGDELLGGYWWYQPLACSERSRPSWTKWMVLRLMARLPTGRRARWQREAVGTGWATRYEDMWTRDIQAQTVFSARDRRKLWLGAPNGQGLFEAGAAFKPDDSVQGMNRGFHFDSTCYLPGDILVKVDRAAMAHGLETRAPFLDRDLFEFAQALPPSLKVSEEQTKIVMREAFEQYWPPELRARGKQGFGGPTARWLELPDVKALLSAVLNPQSALSRLLPGVGRFDTGRNSYQTWTLLVLGLWLQQSGAA